MITRPGEQDGFKVLKAFSLFEVVEKEEETKVEFNYEALLKIYFIIKTIINYQL